MASRKISDLHEDIRDRATAFLDSCRQAGIELLVTCTLRTAMEQDALYAQGRKPLEEVNKLRKLAGLSALTGKPRIVTNAKAGQSKHNSGKAFDVVLLDDAGKPVWDVKDERWQLIGEIGKQCGLEWAGNWKTFKEYPHFEV